MNRFKIIIAGNSVAMRVRPSANYPNNINYSSILQKLLESKLDHYTVQVDNKAKGGLLVSDVIMNIDNLINEYPNYYILNLGVNDASTREVPLWFSKKVNSPVKNRLDYVFSGIHANIFKKNRPFFVKLRGKKTWVKEKDFKNYFDFLISTLIKDTNARIICLPINPANERVEEQLPGSLNFHLRYNEQIKNITNEHGQIYLDTTSFISLKDYPDGIHYSENGHRQIANKLYELIINDLKSNDV